MPLMPKRVKHRKMQKGRMRGLSKGNSEIHFGEYAIQSLGREWITNVQIEAARVALTRFIQRKGKIWIRVFPDKPMTKKPAEVRMGKGKGSVEGWVCPVNPGKILFEIEGVTENIAQEAMRLAASKLPIRTRFVSRKDLA